MARFTTLIRGRFHSKKILQIFIQKQTLLNLFGRHLQYHNINMRVCQFVKIKLN